MFWPLEPDIEVCIVNCFTGLRPLFLSKSMPPKLVIGLCEVGCWAVLYLDVFGITGLT
jgi:hypothetical protein